MFPIATIFVALAMYFLASTIDHHLCPSLEVISEKAKCS